jgi:uncharacterized membrane protein YfcA
VTGLEIGLTIVAGVATGILSAIFGVGGGQVVIPFMLLVLGASQHVAEGTSLVVIVPTALVGAWAHSRRGYVNGRAVVLVTVGGVVGAVAGALVANTLDPDLLQRVYAVFVLWVAWRFLKPRRAAASQDVDPAR